MNSKAVTAYKVVQGIGDALPEGEIVHLDDAKGQPLVDAGILELATEDDLAGGEDVEQVDDMGAVANAAKALETKVTEAVEKATRTVAEKMARNVPAPHIPTGNLHVAGSDLHLTFGFKSLGDFAQTIRNKEIGNTSVAKRMQTHQKGFEAMVSKSPYGSFGTAGGPTVTASDGGTIIPPQYVQNLFERVKNVTDMYNYCSDYEFANTVEIPVENSANPGAGVRAYWQTEDDVVTNTKPVLSLIPVKAQTLMCTVAVTNQQLEDNAYNLDRFLGRHVPTKMIYNHNTAFWYGSPYGAGVLTSAATVAVARTTGGRVTYPDIMKMYAAMHLDNLSNAAWFCSPALLPELLSLTFPDSTGTFPAWSPTANAGGYPNISGAVAGNLLNKPVVLTDSLQAKGTKGDLVFMDGSAVAKIQQQAQNAVSIHLLFDRNSSMFRFSERSNTVFQWLQPWTRQDASTASAAVVLSGGSISVPTP